MAANDRIEMVRGYIGQMPSLPTSVGKVLEVCNNPKTSPIDLDKVIQLDPVLMGKVLKLINSAYYGLSNQVTSLVRAIIMLGINTVKNLALSTAVMERLANKAGFRALNMDGFWQHSLCVGVTAKLVARRRGIDARMLEEYFVAGLLHDIGKIPLNDVLADEYVRVMGVADQERISLYLAEKRALDLDHCETGAAIAEAWRLKGGIADAIAFHHAVESYQGSFPEIVRTVAIANWFASREGIGFSGNMRPEKPDGSTYEALGIDRALLDELEEPVRAEIDKAKVFLKLAQ